MKPLLRLKHGVWSCAAVQFYFLGYRRVVGYGYTPGAAYCDWAQQWSPEVPHD